MPALSVKVIGLPYRNFKEKIRITKHFEKKYHIEDLQVETNGQRGLLYMERKRV